MNQTEAKTAMELKVLKICSYILLILAMSLYQSKINIDIIGLYFVLFINGFLIEHKKEYLKFLPVLLIFMMVNIYQLPMDGENIFKKILLIAISIIINFIPVLILGKLIFNVLKKYKNFVTL